MSIITKKSAGIFFISLLPLVLVFSVFTEAPFYAAIALLAALSLLFISLSNIETGLLIMIAIRPTLEFFSNRLKIDLSNGLSINLPALLGLFAIFLAISFLLKQFNKNKSRKLPKLLIFSIIIFLIINFLSIFISISPLVTIYEIIRLLSIFSIFILSYLVFIKKEKYISLISAIVISSVIPMALAFFQLVTGTGSSDHSAEGRLTGTFSDPNSFASFSVIILGILTYLYIVEKNKRKKILYFISSLFTLFIIFETLSRGGWLAVLIFMLMVIIWKAPKAIFLILFVLSSLFFISETFRERIEDIYNPPATSSIRWRVKQWENLFQVYKNKPLTGYGSGTEIIIHEKEFGFYAGNPYAHNDVLRSALETGIFGALFFLTISLSIILTSLSNYNKEIDKDRKIFIAIIAFIFISEFVFGMTSNIFRSTAVQWCMWALIGVSIPILNTRLFKK